MPLIHTLPTDAVKAAMKKALRYHPWLKPAWVDYDRVIIRETLIICKRGLGIRYQIILHDLTGRYEGFADCYPIIDGDAD